MNKSNAHLYLPLVQALADGKVIQINGVRGWEDTRGDLIFGANPHDYRIKPEPREWWVLIDRSEALFWFNVKGDAMRLGSERGGELVHVREVLPQ